MLNTTESAELSQWLGRAFRDKTPANLLELKNQRDAAEATVRAMELPAELRQAMESLLALHQADMMFLQSMVEALFKRHLRGHHPRE